MTALKKGTGSLNFEDEVAESEVESEDGQDKTDDMEVESSDTSTSSPEQENDLETDPTESTDPDTQADSSVTHSSPQVADTPAQTPDINVENLPYLVQRQMRGASVNADRTKQLLLEVRSFVKDDEDIFLDDLQALVDGPVYKGDAREAAMVVAQENPELVAEKLREWGIEYLDK